MNEESTAPVAATHSLHSLVCNRLRSGKASIWNNIKGLGNALGGIFVLLVQEKCEKVQ